MKSRSIHAMVLAVVLFASLALHAQAAGQQFLFHIDIPFPFIAGGTPLPAGHYHVYHPGDPYLLTLEKDDYRARAVLYIYTTPADKKVDSTKLVFNKYGEQYFLSQAWTGRDHELHETLKCKAERIWAAKVDRPEHKIISAKQ